LKSIAVDEVYVELEESMFINDDLANREWDTNSDHEEEIPSNDEIESDQEEESPSHNDTDSDKEDESPSNYEFDSFDGYL
jgi:hypothetical protein